MTASKKILIIDDDSRNIFALKAILKSRHYNCVSASNAKEGFQLLSTDPDISVVLLDMMMPDMDGYEMLAQMRADEVEHMPVIAVTAQAMVGDREKCLQAGADAYVAKPIDVDVLMDLLKKLENER